MDPGKWMRDARFLGFNVKFITRDNLSSVGFCSLKFDPVTLQPWASPLRVLEKIGWSFKKAPAKNPTLYFDLKAASIVSSFPRSPIACGLIGHVLTRKDWVWANRLKYYDSYTAEEVERNWH